ncbi:vesicle-associated membrane protein 2 isoform X1 [Manis pentadactyla]|nr:vesicle-associated membrane protein 2 isoform X1 [Manis pentadactyla]
MSATAATAPPAAPAGEGGPPAPPPNLTSNRRLQQTQAQVDEVVDIMRVNVDKVLERDQKLSELDDRADALQAGASQFETSAAKLKRKYWWKNLKMMIILGVICAIILIIIIGELGVGHNLISWEKWLPVCGVITALERSGAGQRIPSSCLKSLVPPLLGVGLKTFLPNLGGVAPITAQPSDCPPLSSGGVLVTANVCMGLAGR